VQDRLGCVYVHVDNCNVLQYGCLIVRNSRISIEYSSRTLIMAVRICYVAGEKGQWQKE